jgi:hypothetical protein
MNVNTSEVATIKQQIAEHYQSAQLAMHGYAEVSRHELINARYDRIGKLVDKLGEHMGADNAMSLLIMLLDEQ